MTVFSRNRTLLHVVDKPFIASVPNSIILLLKSNLTAPNCFIKSLTSSIFAYVTLSSTWRTWSRGWLPGRVTFTWTDPNIFILSPGALINDVAKALSMWASNPIIFQCTDTPDPISSMAWVLKLCNLAATTTALESPVKLIFEELTRSWNVGHAWSLLSWPRWPQLWQKWHMKFFTKWDVLWQHLHFRCWFRVFWYVPLETPWWWCWDW